MVYITSHKPEPETILGSFPVISGKARVHEAELGRYTELRSYVEFIESSLGDYSYIMERSSAIYCQIGKFVNIASDVRINPGNHPMHWVCQHHIMYRKKQFGIADSDDESFFDDRRAKRVSIGHDVWVGHGATIMPGVTIGNGAIIGAGSVVTHDVQPFTIVAGVPDKEIRRRFNSNIQEALEAIEWWNWDHDTITKRIDDFRDVDRFVSLYGSK